jgi:hypothetical protein
MIPALRRTVALPNYCLSIVSFILLLVVFLSARSSWSQTVEKQPGAALKPPKPDVSSHSENITSRIQVYDQALLNLRQAMSQIEKFEQESTQEGNLGSAGLLIAKSFKALADGFVGVTGEVTGTEGKVVKAGYDGLQAVVEYDSAANGLAKTGAGVSGVGAVAQAAEAAHKLEKFSKVVGTVSDGLQTANNAADRNYIAASGALVKTLAGMTEIATQDTAPYTTGAKIAGDVTKSFGDLAAAKREFDQSKSTIKSQKDASAVTMTKLKEAIAVLQAKKKLLVEQQLAIRSLQTPSSISDTSSLKSTGRSAPQVITNTSKQATRSDVSQSSRNATSASGSGPVTAGPHSCVVCMPAASGQSPATGSRPSANSNTQNTQINESIQSIHDGLRHPRQITLSPIPEVQSSSAPAGTPTTPVTGNDRGLRVEKITDPILPTKILILNPPAPTEIDLQNSLSNSPQIPVPGQQSTTGTDQRGGINVLPGQEYETDDIADKTIKQLLQKAVGQEEDGKAGKSEANKTPVRKAEKIKVK